MRLARLSQLTANGLLFSISTIVAANENFAASTWRLSGNVQVGVAAIRSTDALYVDEDNERIATLDSDAPAFSTHEVLPLVDLSLLNPATHTKFYVRNPVDVANAVTAGVAWGMTGGRTVDFSLFTKRDDRVWKDPYITNQARDDTKVTNYGATLRYGDLFYTLNHLNVAEDASGSGSANCGVRVRSIR